MIQNEFMIYIIDISGRVLFYDKSLTDAVINETTEEVKLLMPGEGLLSLVPNKYKNSEARTKRLLKAVEGVLNYLYLCILILLHRPKVCHFQWLPFLDFTNIEIGVIRLLKLLSPKTFYVLTIHNVYPHNMGVKQKQNYNNRFRGISPLFDSFIVHTNITREEVVREFDIPEEKVSVCCHGVFVPEGIVPMPNKRNDGKLRVLQFGNQSFYKGTDILVEAICGLEKSLQAKIETYITGAINEKFLNELKAKDKEKRIIWEPYFLQDSDLYEHINNSDLIVLPYRTISQSGVLLLSIYFNKLIICSDLPTFKETLQGDEGTDLDDAFFFNSEDASSLRLLLTKYIHGEIDEHAVHKRIAHLNHSYSWESAAKSTLRVYQQKYSFAKGGIAI